VGFSADGRNLAGGSPDRRLRLLPLIGGTPRPFLRESVRNVDWSPDGARLVYHTGEDGDPIFVADRTGANARQIFVGRPESTVTIRLVAGWRMDLLRQGYLGYL